MPNNAKGIVVNIEKDTVANPNFRKVLYTGKNSQLVLMSIKPGQDIGEEIHKVDQFFRLDGGSGKVVINGKSTNIKDGSAFVIPAGAKHNVINTGNKDIKLYSIYSPPHHQDKTIHKTKEQAEKSNEHFTGKTTENLNIQKSAYLHKIIKNAFIDELEKIAKKRSRAKNHFEALKKNRVSLTPEERKIVMQRGAVWHHGPNGEATPAVWKSVSRGGKTTFIINTHRAWNMAPTLKGAINRYHKFIKGTA